MKKLLLLCLLTPLSGCLGNFTTSGLNATMTSTAAAVGTTVLTGNPMLGMTAGAAAGAATDAIIKEPSKCADISDLSDADKADYLNKSLIWGVLEKLGTYTIIAVLAGLTIIPAIIGYFLPNGRQRKLEKRAFNDPTCNYDLDQGVNDEAVHTRSADGSLHTESNSSTSTPQR